MAALEAGLQPEDTVLDAPIRLGSWEPRNFDGAFKGSVTLEDALALSLNTPSVRLMQQVGGARTVAAVARRYRLRLRPGPPIALNAQITLSNHGGMPMTAERRVIPTKPDRAVL